MVLSTPNFSLFFFFLEIGGKLAVDLWLDSNYGDLIKSLRLSLMMRKTSYLSQPFGWL